MGVYSDKENEMLARLELNIKTITDTYEGLDRNIDSLDSIYKSALDLQGMQSLAINNYITAHSLKAIVWGRIYNKMDNEGLIKKLGVTLVKMQIEGDSDYSYIYGLETLLEHYISLMKDSAQTFRTILATKRAEMENNFTPRNSQSY